MTILNQCSLKHILKEYRLNVYNFAFQAYV
jgi:hypothetical protein